MRNSLPPPLEPQRTPACGRPVHAEILTARFRIEPGTNRRMGRTRPIATAAGNRRSAASFFEFRQRALVPSTVTLKVATEVNKDQTPSYRLVNTDRTDRS
jgi:hypothetical protein